MYPNKKRHLNYSLQNHSYNHNHNHKNKNDRNKYHIIPTLAISFLLFLLVRNEFTLLSEATLLSSLSESKLAKSQLPSLFDLSPLEALNNLKEHQHKQTNANNPVNINQNANENPSEILLPPPTIISLNKQHQQEKEANLVSLEKRSSSGGGGGGGYTTNVGGGRTHVAISLERVKNPDDQPYNSYKKKKFPITWLRNQYPFNTYYNKKSKSKSHYKTAKYGSANDPLVGQYSSESMEFLDPNPSTWVKIPDRPTASIKFHKQTDNVANILQTHSSIPPPSLQFDPSSHMMSGMDMLAHPSMTYSPFGPPPFNGMLPNNNIDRLLMPPAPTAFGHNQAPRASASGLMTSESQNDYQPAQAQAPEPQTGFGGISLSFGNGRSISFGGGQGLTIGGRAGAISIGGKGGDNTPAASGYSETTKGGSNNAGTNAGYVSPAVASQANTGSSTGVSSSHAASYGDGTNGYVSKHPTMSVDIPRKGKTILHANLDMAPIKVRLHSSPRVKITTGSRDPLEKPGDDELAENEEDIFEPPEPFPKQNTTSSANETSSLSNNTSTASNNGTELTTLSPMQLQQQNTRYPQEFNQYGYNQKSVQEQVSFDDYNGNRASRPGYNNNYIHHSSHSDHHHNQPLQYQQQNYHQQQDLQHFQPPASQQGYQAQVPLDGPRFVTQQVQPPLQQSPQQLMPPHHYEHPNYQQYEGVQKVVQQLPERVPFNNQAPPMPVQPMQPMQPMQLVQPSSGSPGVPLNEDQGPAVNHWRQYSRLQMNRFVPKQQDLAADNNPRFYNGNSIVEQRPGALNQQGPEGRDSRDVVDMAASNNDRNYAKINGLNQAATGFQTPQPHFGPSTAYQIAGQPEIIQGVKSTPLPNQIQQQQQQQQPILMTAPTKLLAPKAPMQQLKVAEPTSAPTSRQQPEQQQPQESNYHSSSAYNSQSSYAGGGSRYAHQEAPTRTWTFGNGGISTSYSGGGSGQSGYGSSSYGGGYGSGSYPSDGFDQKNYAAKVEKFDPDAHDKREKSKVVVFLKPRISIHTANSSTTTKRPKNPQRLVHVINRPIFLNNTNNRTHMEEEFIDPDLAEPMELGYGYGYGYGYGNGYNSYAKGRRNKTSTTTRKPRTTTTTTTTTLAPDDSTTASTSSTSETDGTTTTPSTTSSSDDSSSSTTTTDSSSTTTSTTTTELPSLSESPSPDSSTPSSPTETSSSSPDSSSTSDSSEMLEDSSSSSTAASTTTSTTEPSPSDNTSSLPPDVSILDIEGSSGKDSTPEPVDVDSSSSSSPASEDSGADLLMSATEPSKVIVATSLPPPTTTTTSPVQTPARGRAPRPSTTTSTTTTPTSTTPDTPTTTTTPEPIQAVSSTESSTESFEAELQDVSPDPSTTTTTTTSTASSTTASSTSQDEPESDEESQNPSKRSARTDIQTQSISSGAQQQQQQKPMLLNAGLIDKLMNNKTLVSLMSNQLKRVIDTDKMDELEKRRIVRQVFDQMMEEKVDFSMNNVRLAVKTVSSSYRAAAEKQRKKPETNSSSNSRAAKSSKTKQTRSPISNDGAKSLVSSFGKRGVSSESASTSLKDGIDQSRSHKQSKSFPVIDTALKLTKRAHQQPSPILTSSSSSTTEESRKSSRSKITSSSSTNIGAVNKKKNRAAAGASGKSPLGKVDASGNPIVVVLLPQDKA